MASENNGIYKQLVGEFHGLMSDPFSLTGNEDFSLAGEMPDVSSDGVENRAQGLKSFSNRLGGSCRILKKPQIYLLIID